MPRLLFALAVLGTALTLRAAPEYPQQGPDIYDPQADGGAQIATALKQAQARHQHVLLMFGANWCVWCHRLHHTFATDATIATELKDHFVVVLIDVNTRNGVKRNAAVNAQYGNPIRHGLPVLVVLDATGRPLTTQDTGALEEGDHHAPAKVIAFLRRWAPAPKR